MNTLALIALGLRLAFAVDQSGFNTTANDATPLEDLRFYWQMAFNADEYVTLFEARYELDADNCPTNIVVYSRFAPLVAYTNSEWKITFQQ